MSVEAIGSLNNRFIGLSTGTKPTAKVADITVLWRPLVAGGYYLNA
ncbi:MAG: hypothetical protein WC057_05155 [Dehalococcoidales bacterium]